VVRPLVDFSSARGDAPFAFEAPDESFGFPAVDLGGVQLGTAFNIEGGRRFDGVPLDETGTAFEVGGFAQFAILPELRARVEVRRGLGGHKSWVGTAGLDVIARSGDRHVFSVGPRVTLSEARYQRAYFGVTPGEAAATGLAAFSPGGGVHAVGAMAGYLAQISDRWGIYSYAKYDRLIGDAADSPVVLQLGTRNQFSGGLGLSYTFGGNR
jgi:outer membrane protein